VQFAFGRLGDLNSGRKTPNLQITGLKRLDCVSQGLLVRCNKLKASQAEVETMAANALNLRTVLRAGILERLITAPHPDT
jgi:hypothetical protein